MQTFLPYADFVKSAKCLDVKRLGKQRVEAFQLLNVLLERTQTKGWRNHPALKMWIGHSNVLKQYYNVILQEWIDRGYKNTMKFEVIEGTIILPSWFGNEDFHKSHRSNLLRKDWNHYSRFFVEDASLPYIWPTT